MIDPKFLNVTLEIGETGVEIVNCPGVCSHLAWAPVLPAGPEDRH